MGDALAMTLMKRVPPPGTFQTPLTPGTPAASNSSHSDAARNSADPATPYCTPGWVGSAGGEPVMIGPLR